MHHNHRLLRSQSICCGKVTVAAAARARTHVVDQKVFADVYTYLLVRGLFLWTMEPAAVAPGC